ncbi:Fructokinase-like 1, chloroplastic [Linum grandiflorum]
MATFLLSRSFFLNPTYPSIAHSPGNRKYPYSFAKIPWPQKALKATINGDHHSSSGDGAVEIESPKPSRRGRKKKSTTESPPSPAAEAPPKRRRGRPRKVNPIVEEKQQEPAGPPPEPVEREVGDFDDGVDLPYDSPPLVCCFGSAHKEFVPTVKVHDNPMHPDMYSEWKMLQWDPPDFARAPGGPPSNVAIAHVRLGGRAAFMGKVGDDHLGEQMVLMMNKENVQTRSVKFDENARTACTYMKVKFENGKLKMEPSKEAAEHCLLTSELNLSVLKEARMFHFNSEVLMSPSMSSTLYKAIEWSKHFGGLIFFDPNLPLPLWKNRDETRKLIKKAWEEADIIEVSRQELEFLLDERYYEWLKNYKPQYYSESFEQSKGRRNHHHYSREELAPLWHDKLKFLFVTDGTLHIHYYTPKFHGSVIGTEDTLITPFTCDRTGSGDAVVAAIIRKLTTCPEMYENQDFLERQLRFVVSAGIIAQWTIGSVRGLPTENAADNLKEQVYVPSMW